MSYNIAGEGGFRPNGLSKGALLLASMLILMGAAAVAPSLNGIEEEFGAGKFLTSMIITLPALSVALFGFPMGSFADRIGMARTFMLSLAVFSVFGVAGYFADSIWFLLATRFVIGIGIAGISTSTTALIGMYYSGEERKRVIGMQSAFMGVGCVCLEIAGGILADIAWNVPFLIYAIGVPILLLASYGIRDVRPRSFDDGGMERQEMPHRRSVMALCYVAIFVAMFVMFTIPVNMSDYLTRMDVSMTLCGIVLAIMGTAQAVVSSLYARFKRRMGIASVFLLGFLLQAVSLCLLHLENFPVTCIAIMLCGMAMGIMVPTIVSTLSMASPAGSEGKVMGIYSMVMNLGSFCSALVVDALIESLDFADAFLYVGIAVAVFAVAAALFGSRMNKKAV